MIKKTTLMLALCAGLPMLAQSPNLTVTSSNGDSSLTMYGVLDMGVGRVAHGATFAGDYGSTTDPRPVKATTQSVTGAINGGLSGPRLGFKGATKITDDTNAVFTLEMALNIISGQVSNGAQSLAQNVSGSPAGTITSPNAGEYSSDSSLSGQLFGRQANFGVDSKTCGTLLLGRNSNFFGDVTPGYDALGGAQLFTLLGYSSTYGASGGATDLARLDSSVKYRIKLADAFTLGALYKFGGVSGDSSARTVDELMAAYEEGPFGVSFVYENAKDATSVANYMTLNNTAAVLSGSGTGVYTPVYVNPNTLAVTFYDLKSWQLAARYKIGAFNIKGGYQLQQISDPSNPTSDMTMSSIYGEMVGQVITNKLFVGGAEQTKKLTVTWLGVSYDVTSAFNVAVGYYGIHQDDFSNGTSTAADKAGNAKFGSLLLDYRFSKALDAYAGYMGSQYSMGLAAGYPLASNNVLGAGMRYAF
jgi:predicted porin